MSQATSTEVKGTASAKGGCCGGRDVSETHPDTAKDAKHADRSAETPSQSKDACCCGSAAKRDARPARP